MYGSASITPNMHMHCHLKNVILDYGPIYGLWLFSYERYNGILQHQPTNNRSIEVQVLRRFLQDNTSYAYPLPQDFRDELDIHASSQAVTGSLLCMEQNQAVFSVEVPKFYSRHGFSMDEITLLKSAIMMLIPDSNGIEVNSIYCKYKYDIVYVNSIKLASSTPKKTTIVMTSKDHTMVTASKHFAIPSDPSIRACKVNYFAKVSYSFSRDNFTTGLFANVSWFDAHPSRHFLGRPVQLWCPDIFESNLFLSLQHTYLHRCAHSYFKLPDSGENLLAVIPLAG